MVNKTLNFAIIKQQYKPILTSIIIFALVVISVLLLHGTSVPDIEQQETESKCGPGCERCIPDKQNLPKIQLPDCSMNPTLPDGHSRIESRDNLIYKEK